MTIDDRLTTLEHLERLLDAGATVFLRRRGTQWDAATALPINKASCDCQSLRDVSHEGMTLAYHGRTESATGNTLGDVVRDVLTQADLPY
jgi:hypothetical protein